jgi:hypothetical protein
LQSRHRRVFLDSRGRPLGRGFSFFSYSTESSASPVNFRGSSSIILLEVNLVSIETVDNLLRDTSLTFSA